MEGAKGLSSFVSELKARRINLVAELQHVDAALSVLGKMGGGNIYTKPSYTASTTAPKHTMSPAARKRISLAQKARWAATKNGSQSAAATVAKVKVPAKRKISAAGRKGIAAAQRARWAKIKAAKK